MEQHEFNPEAHESFVSRRLLELRKNAARVAIFDELIDMHHDGLCSFDEAVAQYLHDIERDGIGYETGGVMEPDDHDNLDPWGEDDEY